MAHFNFFYLFFFEENSYVPFTFIKFSFLQIYLRKRMFFLFPVYREKDKHIQDLELRLPRVLSDISRHHETRVCVCQCSGSGLDPDSWVFWIQIRIRNRIRTKMSNNHNKIVLFSDFYNILLLFSDFYNILLLFSDCLSIDILLMRKSDNHEVILIFLLQIVLRTR